MSTSADTNEFDIPTYMAEIGQQARAASRLLVRSGTEARNQALVHIADILESSSVELKASNEKDI